MNVCVFWVLAFHWTITAETKKKKKIKEQISSIMETQTVDSQKEII